MPFFNIENVKMVGVSACVPKNIEDNISYPYFAEGEAERVIASTGIKQRRIANSETTSSDLCFEAADKLLEELKWNREEVGCLIYVSQTPDYILPATSCILQKRLGLSQNCLVLDLSIGCPGWIYGMNMISSLMSHGSIVKGLLLVGETPSKYKSYKDKSSWPLFGDAGTATALEFDKQAEPLQFFIAADDIKSAAASNGKLHHHHRETEQQQKEQVHEDEKRSSVLSGDIGEAPDVPQSDGASGRQQDESQSGRQHFPGAGRLFAHG